VERKEPTFLTREWNFDRMALINHLKSTHWTYFENINFNEEILI